MNNRPQVMFAALTRGKNWKRTIKRIFILALVPVFLSGCIGAEKTHFPEALQKEEPAATSAATPGAPIKTPVKIERSELLIDRISENLSSFYDRKWYTLYQEDELDCSRMSTYLWGYIRSNYRVAPKIVVSYERQHAWLALKVSDVGDSPSFSHWKVQGSDYYYLEATVPKIAADDNQRLVVNGQSYTSAEFYNTAIYIFDTPQEANDFQADYSMEGGWNQEFRLKKGDLDKIEGLMRYSNQS